MSLITTLIPAYKPEFLAEVFLGLRRQSLQDFRVLLSDDSPDAQISRLIGGPEFAPLVQGLDLRVVRGPRNARRNHEQLLALWAGSTPLLHFHLDDDLIYPDFYREHAQAHAAGGYGLTVSRRWVSGPDGRPATSLRIPDELAARRERVAPLDPIAMFTTSIPVCDNWLGELTNMVIARDAAQLFPAPPREGLNWYGVMDLGLAFAVAHEHPVGYLHEHLSVFRRNAGQTTHQLHTHTGRIASMCWIAYALQAWAEGLLSREQALQGIGLCTRRCLQTYRDDPVMAPFFALFAHAGQLEALYEGFSRFWCALLASQPGTSPAPLDALAAADAAALTAADAAAVAAAGAETASQAAA